MLKLTRIINKFINFLYFFSKLLHFKIAYLFANQDLPKKAIRDVSIKNQTFVFNKTNNCINLNTLRLFKEEANKLIALLNHAKVKVQTSGNDYFILDIDNISYRIESQNNLNILHEIYIELIYSIDAPHKDVIVLDIGMNIGFATLFFASHTKIKRVYGFEPFTNTYTLATTNFKANPSLSNKITANNFGISNYDQIIDVPVSEAGSVSSSTDSDFIKINKNSNTSNVQVSIKNISGVLNSIMNEHASCPVYLKIDCEGEEYKILNELSKTALLPKVSCLIIEWHFKGSEELNNYLLTNGFSLHEVPIHDQSNYGMIYAFNTRQR